MSRTVHTPGATQAAAQTEEGEATSEAAAPAAAPAAYDPMAEVLRLRAKVAEMEAAKAADPGAVGMAPAHTPHGKVKLAESEYRNMTTTQVREAIDRGEMAEPHTNVLCADGYYCKRG